MKLLGKFLVLAGLAAAMVGGYLFVTQLSEAECAPDCEGRNLFNETLMPIIWLLIAVALWSIAGILAWMRRRFDNLSI